MTKEQKRGKREVRESTSNAPPSAPGQAPAKGGPFIPQAPKTKR